MLKVGSYRSKQLLLKGMGHCENHSSSLKHETAIAKGTEESSPLLTPHIRQPKVPSSSIQSLTILTSLSIPIQDCVQYILHLD